jgi:hypothetical protein
VEPNTKLYNFEDLFLNNPLLAKITSKEDSRKYDLDLAEWNFYKYEELFIFCFKNPPRRGIYDFFIIDIPLSIGRHKYISVEDCFEKAPQEIKNLIVFNLDLFEGLQC